MPTSFSLGSFAVGAETFPGLVIDDAVYDIRQLLPGVANTHDVLVDWSASFALLSAAADDASRRAGVTRHALSELAVLPPVQPVGALYGAGANYREHVIQMTVAHRLGDPDASEAELRETAARELDERTATGQPYVWTGVASAVSGAYDDIVLPALGENHDWELELGVVIGRTARNVSVDDALDYVAGYTICNDLTTRSLVARTDIPMMGTDWLRAKNQPTFYPTGPALVPAAFVGDPQDLMITLKLNGQVMQNASSSDMLFGVARLIAYISALVTIEPGDMIITGSPDGNGSHWGRFMQHGDVIESSITGLGTQRNTVRDPSVA